MPRPPSAPRPPAAVWRRSDGQAAVELVGVLPFACLVCAVVWQLALAGHAAWAAGAAARAAARASAIGLDAEAAARGALPSSLERRLRVRAAAPGSVEVAVRIPAVGGGVLPVGSVRAGARFAPQGG